METDYQAIANQLIDENEKLRLVILRLTHEKPITQLIGKLILWVKSDPVVFWLLGLLILKVWLDNFTEDEL